MGWIVGNEGNITSKNSINSTLIVNSTLVPGISEYLYNMKIRVTGFHTWQGDLGMTLTGPEGNFIILVNQTGGGADHFDITVCICFFLKSSNIFFEFIF